MYEDLTVLRHHIHQHPELSTKEFATAEYLKAALISKGLPRESITPCFHPGFYADIVGEGQPTAKGLCVAFRTELDALAVKEENEDLPYKSENAGVGHMCGHDGHMSIVIGLGWELLRQKSVIPSNCKVRLIFQPSEEVPPGGALAMIEAGCLQGVDEIYAFHSSSGPLGGVFIRDTSMLSQSTTVEIRIKGKSGHGAYPQCNSDCVLTAAYVLTQLHSIIPRNVSCFDQAVLTICQVHAGSAHNVLPGEVSMEGTIRSYCPETRDTIKIRIAEIVTRTAEAHGCTAECHTIDGYPPTINHKSAVEHIRRATLRLFPASLIPLPESSTASEDFSYYLMQCKGAMAFLGNGSAVIPHNSRYNFNDEALKFGVGLWVGLLEDRFSVSFS